ncbi:hypothetical protein AAG570_013046 [Ranatra chinensis]|uniref:Battenin n=1 Tax=Ranatra chinensis TaxID=642074 RepID=A0ABD0YS43_9HEMI
MLSAAHDILGDRFHDNSGTDNSTEPVTNSTLVRDCNHVSTGAILLADIMPSLVIKILAPFFPLYIHVRMIITLVLSCCGYILVGSAMEEWVAILGVVCTALSSGLGEASLLSYMAFYKNKNVISTWSSGTGGAGFFGSFTYAGLTSLFHLSPSTTLYSLLVVPVIMGLSFWLLLKHPDVNALTSDKRTDESTDSSEEGLSQKIKAMPALLKYMIPLGLVYLFEYIINQGLFELIQFDLGWLSHADQYRWYQVDYQIGVFLSRSSINFIQIKLTWILAILQGVNLVLFATEAVYSYAPHIAFVLLFVLWEGLLGGASYVNTYHRISVEVPPEKREFSMAITSLADALGISIAGFVSMPLHNHICNLPRYHNEIF